MQALTQTQISQVGINAFLIQCLPPSQGLGVLWYRATRQATQRMTTKTRISQSSDLLIQSHHLAIHVRGFSNINCELLHR